MSDVKVNIWLNRAYNSLICYVNKKVRMWEVTDRAEKKFKQVITDYRAHRDKTSPLQDHLYHINIRKS